MIYIKQKLGIKWDTETVSVKVGLVLHSRRFQRSGIWSSAVLEDANV
jgi:hypothetical protein